MRYIRLAKVLQDPSRLVGGAACSLSRLSLIVSAGIVAAGGYGHTNAQDSRAVLIELYVEETHALSEQSISLLSAFAESHHGVLVNVQHVTKPAAATKFARICEHYGLNQDVPVVYTCNRAWPVPDEADRFEESLIAAIRLDIYRSEDCPACEGLEQFAGEIQKKYPGLEVGLLDVGNDPAAKELLDRRAESAGVDPSQTYLPVFEVCQALVFGHPGPKTTEDRLDEILERWTYSISGATSLLLALICDGVPCCTSAPAGIRGSSCLSEGDPLPRFRLGMLTPR